MVTQNYQCIQNHETWFILRTHRSNCNRDVTMLEHVFINFNLCCIQCTSFVSVEGRVDEIQSHKLTRVHQNHINGLFHGLTAPYLMGMSQYFYIHPTVQVSCPQVVGFRRYDWTKLPMHQNHKTWATSWGLQLQI